MYYAHCYGFSLRGQGSHKLAYAVITRRLLREITAGRRHRRHTNAHGRCPAVIRGTMAAFATETRLQLSLHQTTAAERQLEALARLIALIIRLRFKDSSGGKGALTVSSMAFQYKDKTMLC